MIDVAFILISGFSFRDYLEMSWFSNRRPAEDQKTGMKHDQPGGASHASAGDKNQNS